MTRAVIKIVLQMLVMELVHQWHLPLLMVRLVRHKILMEVLTLLLLVTMPHLSKRQDLFLSLLNLT